MPLDPVEQTLEMGRTPGSGGGDSVGVGGFVQVLLAKRAMQQRQQEHADEVNLAQQRLNLEDQQQQNQNQRSQEEGLMAPLLRAHQSAINMQTGATAQGAVLDARLKADQMAGLNGLTALELRAANTPLGVLDPAVISDMNTLFTQHPGLTISPTGARYLANMQRARKTQEFAATFGKPESVTVSDTETGATLVFGNKTNPTADVQDLQYLERLKQAVVNAPTPEARASAQSALDDARVKLKVAPEATDATKAVQTRLEEQSAAAANAFTTAKQLIPFLADGSNSGLMGLEQRAQESVTSLLGGKLGSNSATEAAAINTRLKSELIGMARADGNLARSEKQVEAIVSGMPDVTRWFHGASQAKVQLADAIGQIGDLSRANAKTLGKPISPEWLKPDEIVNMFASGKISRKQVDQLQQNNGWEIIRQLRSSAIK